jgi:tRNA threonylcarbamoyladenosine modification (KEOPS) complex  Pcc1 subunit
MTAPSEWEAAIDIRRPTPEAAERLLRTLRPEAAREVPRVRATLTRSGAQVVTLRLLARDTGALRAALNTFLGWVSLAERTESGSSPPQRGIA